MDIKIQELSPSFCPSPHSSSSLQLVMCTFFLPLNFFVQFMLLNHKPQLITHKQLYHMDVMFLNTGVFAVVFFSFILVCNLTGQWMALLPAWVASVAAERKRAGNPSWTICPLSSLTTSWAMNWLRMVPTSTTFTMPWSVTLLAVVRFYFSCCPSLL